MADIQDVIQQMKELTDTVKDHQADPATVDFDDLKDKFSGQIKEMVDAQVKEKMDAQPVRRGDPVFADEQTPMVGKSNPFYSDVQRIREDGFSMSGNVPLKAVDFWLANYMLEKAANIMPDRVTAPSEDLKAALKAMTSTGSGTGDELVPNDMAAMLWEDTFLASRIVDSMMVIDMPTNPFDVSLGLGDVTWRKGTENTATTASDPATAKSVLTATELVTEVNWSYTLNEDSIVALMPAIRQRLAISGGEIIDDFALNADATNAATGNINLDDADPPDDSYYLSDGQDGLRHLWLVDNTGQGTDAGGNALTDADITAMLADMGKYASNQPDVLLVCDTQTYLKGFLATGTGAPGEYLKSIGDTGFSVIVDGQVGAYRGVPIIISESAPLTMADGKASTTAGNNTLGQITAFNRSKWYAGFRRNILVEVDRDIQKRQWIMVVSLRPAVAAHGTRASATHTAGVYNILV